MMTGPGTITGTIESNNGTEALVSFADGAQQLFKRSTGSEAEFLAAFPVGGTARAKPFVGKFATCLDLFSSLEELFREREIEYGIAGTLDRGSPTDVVLVLTISGMAVLCRPFLESQDGGDGQFFALRRGGRCEWLELTEENFEYVCGEIANANNSENADGVV